MRHATWQAKVVGWWREKRQLLIKTFVWILCCLVWNIFCEDWGISPTWGRRVRKIRAELISSCWSGQRLLPLLVRLGNNPSAAAAQCVCNVNNIPDGKKYQLIRPSHVLLLCVFVCVCVTERRWEANAAGVSGRLKGRSLHSAGALSLRWAGVDCTVLAQGEYTHTSTIHNYLLLLSYGKRWCDLTISVWNLCCTDQHSLAPDLNLRHGRRVC